MCITLHLRNYVSSIILQYTTNVESVRFVPSMGNRLEEKVAQSLLAHLVLFEIKPFITCSTTGVVYLLLCLRGLQHVGRTKRVLPVRLSEHNNIRKRFKHNSVSKHYAAVHNRDPSNTIFLDIDKYSPHWRGSSLVRAISKLEMSWIHSEILCPTWLRYRCGGQHIY